MSGPVRACVLSVVEIWYPKGGVWEMARHRYRQSQFAGLTRLQLDEVGRERQVQQQGSQRAEALAERSVEIAQAMVPLAGALARGGG